MRAGTTLAVIVLLQFGAAKARGADPAGVALKRTFSATVQPFLQSYCFPCHGKEKQKGKLDLSSFSTVEAVAKDYPRWEVVLDKLKSEDMPPEEAKRHPTAELRREIIAWIQAVRRHEAAKNAGDPGIVLARRLSNAEYDYTIRDLTGVDLRPAREFPVDPANQAGFDNSGESLALSPALLKKYLEAARRLADHIVLKPEGFVFAPHPVVTEPDRDKYCVQRIVEFYRRQPTNYAGYFLAAWRYKNRAGLGHPDWDLSRFASEARVSSRYLAAVWSALELRKEEMGPLGALQTLWRELPAPGDAAEAAAQLGSLKMGDFIATVRQSLKPEVENLALRGIAPGSQPFVLWKDRQYATNRLRYARGALPPAGAALGEGDATGGSSPVKQALAIPGDDIARRRFQESLDRFCALFPDAFYLSERGLIFLKEDKESQGRWLSAGFHLMTGYFRDDEPLCRLILDETGRHELDRLWQELNFITLAPIRQYKDFIFFERAEPPRFMYDAEFDFARSEDQDAISGAKIQQLARAYLAKARQNGGEGAALEAIEDYFNRIRGEIRWVETNRLAAEAGHLQALLALAERAYRRPLAPREQADLLAFYRSLRQEEGLDHENAIRDTVASLLISPAFWYRIQPPDHRNGVHPLSDYALASRLSYFLWSSMPDAELLSRAAAGDLHRHEVLLAQTRRMLRDERVRGLVLEFGGNWLDFRRFEEHNSVDRGRFRTFNNELRQAMFEEPVRFFLDLIREDRSVLNFLDADYTFVNGILAAHYAIPSVEVRSNEWVRVDDAHRHQRGGLLPMSVFLTKNSPGLRTSPVKRGYWVVRRLLGEQIPPPPPVVPELPGDEAKLGELTLRETLARHRADKSCAACHARFDSFGLVFEGYGPVGELRDKDFGGHPVDTRATFPGGTEGAGLDGLRDYLRQHRQSDFLDNLCRKLLAYALGRTLMLSDDPAVEEMRVKLATNDYRFSSLVESLVTSRQFLTARGRAEVPTR